MAGFARLLLSQIHRTTAMYTQASAKIELPSYLPQQNPAAILDGVTVQPVSFFAAGTEIYALGEKDRGFTTSSSARSASTACSPMTAGR